MSPRPDDLTGPAAAERAPSPGPAPSPSGLLLWGSAALSTTICGAVLGWQIQHRTALTMDELHSALLGRLVQLGDPLPFYEGSVTRYEGGSWLVGFPVGWWMELGAGPVAATSWTAGCCSLLAVLLLSRWIAGWAGPRRALLVGAVTGFVLPEWVHYSYRLWGSISESLFIAPLVALVAAPDGVLQADRPSPGRIVRVLGTGLMLGIGMVLSYVHGLTALTLAGSWLWAGRAAPRRAIALVASAAAVATATLGAWTLWHNPFVGEALRIRDGRTIGEALGTFATPPVVEVVRHLPGAFIGEHLTHTPIRVAAGVALALLSAGALAAVARTRSGGRAMAMFAGFAFCAVGVGHTLLEPPGVYRYYLPLLLACAGALAAGGPRFSLPALALSAAMWWPDGLPMPYQLPQFTHVELGGNALHRWGADPHRKFFRFLGITPDWEQSWLAFGYGLDSGRRYGPTVSSMREWLATLPNPEATIRDDPHFNLAQPRQWVEGWDGVAEPEAERAFFFGLGLGLIGDGQLSELDVELLDAHTSPRRIWTLEGVGAGFRRAVDKGGRGPTAGWEATLVSPRVGDWQAIGRGAALVGAGPMPEAPRAILLAGPFGAEIAAGLQAEPDLAMRAMARVPMVPTP